MIAALTSLLPLLRLHRIVTPATYLPPHTGTAAATRPVA